MMDRQTRPATIAWAMAASVICAILFGIANSSAAPINPINPLVQPANRSALPQLTTVPGAQGEFPPLTGSTQDPSISTETTPSYSPISREHTDSPTAPLPPALIAGPIGIAYATWMARRANRRGGRI